MKIDLFISLLDGKRIKKSTNVDLSSYQAVDVDETPEKTDDEPIKLQIQSNRLGAQKRRALEARDQNLHQLEQLKSKTGQYPNPDIKPISLSDQVAKPNSSFEKSLDSLLENPEKLLESHQEIDRDRVLGLLKS